MSLTKNYWNQVCWNNLFEFLDMHCIDPLSKTNLVKVYPSTDPEWFEYKKDSKLVGIDFLYWDGKRLFFSCNRGRRMFFTTEIISELPKGLFIKNQ